MSYRPYSVYKAERMMRRRRRRLLYGIVGLFVTIGVVVGASYLWVYLQWQKTQIDDPTLDSVIQQVNDLYPTPAGTMNILIMGIDERGWEDVRSDSMILVHADPANNYLATLSLPRDLKVEVPGFGAQKLNFSFAKGGRDLCIQTVSAATGVGITHYVEISLDAFKNLTDAVGGVYIDVDKHYYDQEYGWEPTDIPAGYQLMDGTQGLDYVRFRHDGNADFGRQQRQQRFIAALREQALKWDLGLKLPGLIQALTDNIQTQISFEEMRNLTYWAITKLSGGQMRQLAIIGSIQNVTSGTGQNISVVIPEEAAFQDKLAQFLNTSPSSGSGTTPGTAGPSGGTPASTGVSGAVDSTQFITNPSAISEASMWKDIAAVMPFKVMAPGYLPENYVYSDRNPTSGPGYAINTGNGSKNGLKVVYRLVKDGTQYSQYLGIMETDWLDAPAASPGQQVTYNDMTFTVVGTLNQTERVWWKKDGVLYWVSNTILHNLNSDELIKVAASMMTIGGGTASQ